MTPLAPVDEKRIAILRVWVNGSSTFPSDVAFDLLAILDDYSVLKAENEGWAEVLEDAANKHLRNLDRIAKLEAELAKQAPLIQAAVGADIKYEEIIDGNRLKFNGDLRTEGFIDILRAALALREEKK